MSLESTATLSPKCRICKVNVWDNDELDEVGKVEKDGVVKTLTVSRGNRVHVYARDSAAKGGQFAVTELDNKDIRAVRLDLTVLHYVQQSWPSIRDSVSKVWHTCSLNIKGVCM